MITMLISRKITKPLMMNNTNLQSINI